MENKTTIKKWTIEDIRKIFIELDMKTNLNGAKLPIKISSRMIRTKGYFRNNRIYDTKVKKIVYIPCSFTFSEILLDGRYSEEVVRNTIIHEYAHFYCTIKYSKIMGHSIEWKKECKLLGGDGQTYFRATANEEVVNKSKGNKTCYIIECLDCGNKSTYLRETEKVKRLFKNTNNFRCGKCKGSLKAYKDTI